MLSRPENPFNFDFVDLPYGDKSITHRALICCALSKGKCLIKNPAINADTLATLDCLNKLGAKIKILDGNTIEVLSITQPNTDIVFDCKNSGTTARLLAGVVAGMNVHVTFVGDTSLSSRPMQRVISPLTQMGAKINKKKGCLFEILPSGKLKGITYQTPIPSAQVKSAILFAGLFAEGNTKVIESISTRNHTEKYLQAFGADIVYGDGFAEVTSCKPLKAIDVEIPNDFSTATFLIALGLKQGITLKNVGLNPTRTAFLKWLSIFGARVETKVKKYLCNEPVGDVSVSGFAFKPVNAAYELCNEMIDELPVCCLLSSLAIGDSKFEGISELKYKESDRIKEIKNLLKSFGVETVDIDDGLIVKGRGKLCMGESPDTTDHRIAMLGIVAGGLCGQYLPAKHPNCIDVSCPNFKQLIGFNFKWGLFGKNIKNSLSPKIYQSLSNLSGIKSNYTIFDFSEEKFDNNFEKIFNHLNGANLTIPFKAKLTTKYNPANTLKRVGERILFFNTDGYGLLRSLKEENIDVAGKSVLVLGCGGAGIEAIRVLTNAGAKVYVRNRTISKVEELSKIYPIQTDVPQVFEGILSFLPFTEKLVLVSKEEISNAEFIFDACYSAKTPFLVQAESKGKKIIYGKSMLFWQAVKNFEIWTGKQLSNNEIKKALNLFLKETE